jgi:hypothetical protein
MAYTKAPYKLMKKQIGSMNISKGTIKYFRAIPRIEVPASWLFDRTAQFCVSKRILEAFRASNTGG